MNRRGLFALALVSLFPALPIVALAADDAKPLQGAWIAKSMEVNGAPAPAKAVERVQFTFEGDKLSIKGNFSDERVDECTYKVDGEKSPKHLDISHPKETKPIVGIYKVNGDTLTVCLRHASSNEGRPNEFVSKADSNLVLITFEKKK